MGGKCNLKNGYLISVQQTQPTYDIAVAHSQTLVKYSTTINICWLPTGKGSGTIDLQHTTPTALYPQPQDAGTVVTYTIHTTGQELSTTTGTVIGSVVTQCSEYILGNIIIAPACSSISRPHKEGNEKKYFETILQLKTGDYFLYDFGGTH